MPDSHPRNPLKLPDIAAPNPRADYVELGVTSAFSFLHGASQPSELALAAHLLGHDALGIADINSLAGVVRLRVAARQLKLRPLIGAIPVEAMRTANYSVDRDADKRTPVEAAAARHGLAAHPQLAGFLQRIHARPAYQRALAQGGPFALAGG